MNEFVLPETHYAQSGEVSIAFQTMGNGPIDIILVPGFISHVELMHDLSGYTAFLRRLSTFARVITFDKRGQGLSDRVSGAPSLEQRMDDVRAIMDRVGSRRVVLMGFSEGSAMSVLFAASCPERVTHLILFGGFAALPGVEDRIEHTIGVWGTGALMKTVMPSHATNQNALNQAAKLERFSASPGAVRATMLMNAQINIGALLPSVQTPTLVLHRCDDIRIPIQLGRDLAAGIPHAKLIEYPGNDHAFWAGDIDTMLGDIEEFVTGHRNTTNAEFERILATVMFTDIIDSTRKASEMGDARWRTTLDSHDELARRMIETHRGVMVKQTGDGVLATFDGPGRAIRCAIALSKASHEAGLSLRAGLHTGEIELRGKDIGGIAVHAAARVMSLADSGEILVSRVVTDLVAGTGLKFSAKGFHDLKGLPGPWEIFAASMP